MRYVLTLLAAALLVSAASAQSSVSNEADWLADAMRTVVAVQTPRGPLPVRHCRRAPAAVVHVAGPGSEDRWARCMGRLRLFARYFVEAGRQHNVDPWILAAMARQESGYNPFASGSVGEGGIAQLHPRGVGSRSRFVRDERYRTRCARQPGACQDEVVELQAEHLRAWVDRCGDVKRALGGYNSGHCGITRYTNHIARWHTRLVRARAE